MAYQVRADCVEMHFSLWETTFGEADTDKLGNPYFDWDETPSSVWSDSYLERSYYRDGSLDSCGKSDTLEVNFEDDLVSLKVYRFADDDTEAGFSENAKIQGWQISHVDGKRCAQTKPIPILAFIEKTEFYVDGLKSASCEMINYLLAD